MAMQVTMRDGSSQCAPGAIISQRFDTCENVNKEQTERSHFAFFSFWQPDQTLHRIAMMSWVNGQFEKAFIWHVRINKMSFNVIISEQVLTVRKLHIN